MEETPPPEKKHKRKRKLMRLLALPVFYLSSALYKVMPHNKKKSILIIGIGVAFGGVCVSKLHIPYVHHYITDFVGYALHGFGLIPIAKVIDAYIDVDE